ncbi:multispanning membrane protein [Delitschia confertaspora ATCC 74209]|uniref:Transmembrane 9 superfamily member n=1 Tax=Delitschia confertaspora ATCC 74209 TaxID=1513339 RepID=A0A9P4N109_9PLEO|nr:multispanning membrane protein [Delitschia confertaspora ATCC 74209]
MHADVRRTAAVFCSFLALTQAFYIPGISIKTYKDGETIPLFVNKLYSDHSELSYAYSELPFVCPISGRNKVGRFTSGASLSLNLGEVLRGDRITVSDYELVMGNDEEARYLCSHTVDRAGLKRTRELIRDGYVAEWIVDNLPGATSFQTTDKSRKYYAAGFKIGEEVRDSPLEPPRYFLNNHVTLVIRYHRAPGRDGDQGKKVIVGFEVFPKSIEAGNRTEDGLPTDIQNVSNGLEVIPRSNSTGKVDDTDDATLTIPYTYSVYFREDERLEWKNRWDMYFVAQDDSSNIHWLAIINSLVISGLLTIVVAVIFGRTIRGDIKLYMESGLDEGKPRTKKSRGTRSPKKSFEKNGLLDQVGDLEGEGELSSDEELEDITGWKLVHGDVFRSPPYGGLLAPLVGSGTQLLFMAAGLLILSTFGILNPSFRGGYVSVGMGLFVLAGLFSGYFSSRVYKTFGGQLWQKNVFVTATLVPGLVFTSVFILNLFVWAQASSTALPFGTLLGLVALWLLVQLPLVYIGGRYGYVKGGAWTHPIKANVIPRQIPAQSWYMKSFQAILLAGFIPFAVIFIELMFVFKSLWQDKSGYYYMFGFLAVVSVILVLTVIEVTIVATYVQLCSENYHWWWQSFIVGGSSSIWIFGYVVWYYFTKLHISGFVSSLLFFCYGFLACGVYALLTGTIGFLAAYAFVRRIYGAIKVD